MQDNKVRLSVSVPWCALAMLAWVSMAALLALGAWTQNLTWSSVGLAFSAVGATLQIRCFMVRLNRNLRNAFELGVDSARAKVRPISVARD